MWELQILSINHSIVFQLSWKIKRKALGFTAHSALFVLSAKSIPLPSMECLWFGNDFLAGSVCLHLRPQTRVSEVSHKWKFVLLFSSSSTPEIVCASLFMPFQQALREWKHQLSHPGTETQSRAQFWEHRLRRQSRQLSSAWPCLEPSLAVLGISCGCWVPAQLLQPHPRCQQCPVPPGAQEKPSPVCYTPGLGEAGGNRSQSPCSGCGALNPQGWAGRHHLSPCCQTQPHPRTQLFPTGMEAARTHWERSSQG